MGNGGTGGLDCGLIPPVAPCLVGPTIVECTTDATGRRTWKVSCGDAAGAGGAAGVAGAGGAAGAGGSGGSAGAPCASTSSCAAGEVCTTEDGVCHAPPGCSMGVACPAVCYGTCRPAGDVGGACSRDADCRVEADYCTGCDCRALATGQRVPACPGPGVRCLVDPCGGKTAACVNGGCIVQ
jgi:hypothetical protein